MAISLLDRHIGPTSTAIVLGMLGVSKIDLSHAMHAYAREPRALIQGCVAAHRFPNSSRWLKEFSHSEYRVVKMFPARVV